MILGGVCLQTPMGGGGGGGGTHCIIFIHMHDFGRSLFVCLQTPMEVGGALLHEKWGGGGLDYLRLGFILLSGGWCQSVHACFCLVCVCFWH